MVTLSLSFYHSLNYSFWYNGLFLSSLLNHFPECASLPTEQMPASVCTPARGTLISLCQSPPYIIVNSRNCCLHKSLACFSSGHLWILFNSALFFSSLGAYGWLDCVGPCQRPSITPWCPAELEIHSAALSPQNEKTRARENKVRLRARERKGGWKERKMK